MAAGVLTLSRAAKRSLRIDRLCNAMRTDRQSLLPYLSNYKHMVKLLAGSRWSGNASEYDRPYNGIQLFVSIVKRALVNQTPRMMLTTWQRDHRRSVWAAQEWGNKQCEKIHLGEHLERWVMDALLFMGVMKVGITSPVDESRLGERAFMGEAYAECINPDDFVPDMQARVWDEMTYFGHRYRADLDVANKFHQLGSDEKLTQTPNQMNQEGEERVGVIGRGYVGGGGEAEYVPKCDLWEVYDYSKKILYTFRSQQSGVPGTIEDMLEAREYVGPADGPYTRLSLLELPGQLLGKGPAMDQVPLDMGYNAMLRKLLRQAERMKQLQLYTGAASEDMARINEAYDGKDVQVNRQHEITQFTTQPPNPQLFALMMAFKKMHSEIAGNMEVMGGLARQAGTAAQESQMNNNANATLAAYQQTVNRQTSQVMSNLCWHFWHDPKGVMRATRKLESYPGVERTYDVTPEERAAVNWDDLAVKVDPYSMSADTPQSRLQHLRALVNQAMPMMQFMGQQGLGPDFKYWLRKEGEYSNNPDVEELFHLVDPMPGESPQGDEGAGKPPVTQRNYTRTSESEATPGGQATDDIQQMMGAGGTGAGDFGGNQ